MDRWIWQANPEWIERTNVFRFMQRLGHTGSPLPKTQSGKVARRLIRQRYLGQELEDTSTVENPAALEDFRSGAVH